MTSQRESVTLPGRLVGMGQDINCTVCALKVSLPGTAEYNYVRPIICDVPADLPDGIYSIRFGGKTEMVQRKFGSWIAVLDYVPPQKQ
jgi:hypothetical protein